MNKFFWIKNKNKNNFFKIEFYLPNSKKIAYNDAYLTLVLENEKLNFIFLKNQISILEQAILKISFKDKKQKPVYLLAKKIYASSSEKIIKINVIESVETIYVKTKNDLNWKSMIKKIKSLKKDYRYFLWKSKLGLTAKELIDKNKLENELVILKMMKGNKLVLKNENKEQEIN
ncbi:MSC_0621 family F1-like ATPase epsilon subunit [Mesomycoplasma lagogenitalium]|uniref:Uncharacterized protein n=1 Tax=Mesomycoplasma lagogenitalium TaxID=171286 RepID=A0ABY8LUV9_9BACT|nr:hypothetical protein [Mesomycoplasma lagogenitalium]WGI37030.1 hypothetical protein QEG99_01965 [Mesomycoplasma lagogenitalium]